MWIKAFGKAHVQSLTSIKKSLNKYLSDFNNKVVIESSRKSKKHSYDDSSTCTRSMRHLIKEWRFSNVHASKYRGKSRVVSNNDLFNIGVSMGSVTGNEQVFYV